MGLILLKYWKYIVITVTIGILAYTGYSYIYQQGYTSAETKYQAMITEYQQEVAKRIEALEVSSTKLVEQNEKNAQTLSKDLNVILTTVKNKPLYKIENGKCTPSVEFIDSYNSIILRGNQK